MYAALSVGLCPCGPALLAGQQGQDGRGLGMADLQPHLAIFLAAESRSDRLGRAMELLHVAVAEGVGAVWLPEGPRPSQLRAALVIALPQQMCKSA